jgi:hypothetical protein
MARVLELGMAIETDDALAIERLMAGIAEAWPFYREAYPHLRNGNSEIIAFAITHCTLHLMKATGTLAACAESADHGHDLDMAVARQAIMKLVSNSLRLAEICGVSGANIVEYVENTSLHAQQRPHIRLSD